MDLNFGKFKSGLERTKTILVRNLHSLFKDTGEWDTSSYERLEESLIAADIGVQLSERIVNVIKDRYEHGHIQTSADIIACTKTIILEMLHDGQTAPIKIVNGGTTVILLVGVNGSGKTTTAGKLATLWQEDNRSVMLAACDTFRAAAIEQIRICGDRIGCPVIASGYGADAAAVAYDAIHAAIARKIEILLIDTAGRQHTKRGLMDELAKIHRIIGKAYPGAPHEIWLVIDGSTGTNALQQARIFRNSVPITGLCVTKLDGSSKGGSAVAIYQELKLPIRFVGLGEQSSDLQPFDSGMFVDAMFSE